MTVKNRKLPKTHTVLGVKCKLCKQTIFHPYWRGENDQFQIQIWQHDHLSFRHPNDKKYLVEVILSTFHQVVFEGTGNTLKECEKEISNSIYAARKKLENIDNEIANIIWKF